MEDIDDELREIKREIVESRGLVIRTNHLTTALAADLKTIAKRQQSFERVAFFNSAVAFIVFATVVLSLVYVAWNARMDSVTQTTRDSTAKVERVEKELEASKALAAQRSQAEIAAATFYELVRAGRKREVIDAFPELRKQPLSRAELAFFTDAVERAKGGLSVEAYQAGREHERKGRWHEAAQAFKESVALSDGGSHAPSAELELARAYRKLGQQTDAIPILTRLSEASENPEILDDATMLLAECLIDVEAYNDARTTLRQFIRRFPDSPLLNDARMALADVNLKK
jgi:TolA-binding protein